MYKNTRLVCASSTDRKEEKVIGATIQNHPRRYAFCYRIPIVDVVSSCITSMDGKESTRKKREANERNADVYDISIEAQMHKNTNMDDRYKFLIKIFRLFIFIRF